MSWAPSPLWNVIPSVPAMEPFCTPELNSEKIDQVVSTSCPSPYKSGGSARHARTLASAGAHSASAIEGSSKQAGILYCLRLRFLPAALAPKT